MKGSLAISILVPSLAFGQAAPAVYTLGPRIDFENRTCMFSDVSGRTIGSTAVKIEVRREPLISITTQRATNYEGTCKFFLPVRDSQPLYSAPEGMSCLVITRDGLCEDPEWTQEISPAGRVTLYCECTMVVRTVPPPVPFPLVP